MAYSGTLVLLKLQINDKWEVVGGMRTTKFTLNNQIIDASNKSSGSWRLLLEQAGLRHINISGAGVFTNNSAEIQLRYLAFTGEIKEYQLTFSNGDVLQGKFQIIQYERIGNFAEEECYNLSLSSSGEMQYIN